MAMVTRFLSGAELESFETCLHLPLEGIVAFHHASLHNLFWVTA